jgi:hypothetical protein
MSRGGGLVRRWLDADATVMPETTGSDRSPGQMASAEQPAGPDASDRDEVVRQAALQRALRAAGTEGDVIVGPWTGEVGFELLYWIPFLGWLAGHGISGSRMVVVSRGGAGPWYRHLTTRYVDILDLMSPDEFRARTAGKKKQYDERRGLDRDIVETIRTRLSLPEACVVHPSAMFRLFSALWRKRATVDLVESYTSFQALAALSPAQDERPAGVPAEYVVAKFYFSKAFPDTQENRVFVARTLRTISRQVPVVLLNTAVRLDEHVDVPASGESGVVVVNSHAVPVKNLECQTRLIAGARGFVGTYGGFSYLAPFYSVPSLSFFSRRNGFEAHHLDLADRVFERLLPGGFVALDRRATARVDLALSGWGTRATPLTAVET